MGDNKFTTAGLLLGLATLLAAAPANADIRAGLDGYQENPSISTEATGRFRAKLHPWDDKIKFRLSYADIASPVRFAHIHLARRHVNGGVIVWLCDNTGNSPIAVEPCPQGGGSVEGVITPESVTGLSAQGIPKEGFGELLDAIEHQAAYVNVHSDAFPGGEIRGQIRGHFRGDNDRDDNDRDDNDKGDND